MLNEAQKKLLLAICSKREGIDIHEAMEITGLDYTTIEGTAYELLSRGYEVRAMALNGNVMKGQIKHLFISKYDPQYEELIGGSK